MNLKYSVGLDVSSKDIKACFSTIDFNQQVKVKSSRTVLNTSKGLLDLYNWSKSHCKEPNIPLTFTMEATGVYHENCAFLLKSKGCRVSIVLPNKAKRYLQSIGLKSKNDSIDAKGLAQMGAEQCLEEWSPMGTYFYELRTLTRQHHSLQETLTAEKCRLHASKSGAHQLKFEQKQIEKLIKFLEQQLEQVLLEINKHVKSNQVVNEKLDKIVKIYGVGVLTAATIIAETGGFELFSNYKQLVSYAGYDVVENQSGKHQGKTKISKKGNSRIRRILHIPALNAKKKEGSKFKALFERVYERTGKKMKGVVAVQKKLLLMIYYIWKNDIDYIESYENIQKEEQETSSPEKLALKKPIKKATTSVASQGKHPVSYHSMPPLRTTKLENNYI